MNPHTADEREKRFGQYCLACNKGQLAEVRLTRLNRAANFRKAIRELIEEFVETRAEDLAAGMLQEHCPERAQIVANMPQSKRRRMPVWIRRMGSVENERLRLAR